MVKKRIRELRNILLKHNWKDLRKYKLTDEEEIKYYEKEIAKLKVKPVFPVLPEKIILKKFK